VLKNSVKKSENIICIIVFFKALSFPYTYYIHDILTGPLMSVPPCDLNGSGCFEWNVNGWENTNLSETEIDRPFSGKL
jgi:hypothetical protein